MALSFLAVAAQAGLRGPLASAVLGVAFAIAVLARTAEHRQATTWQLVSALPSLAIAGLCAHTAGATSERGLLLVVTTLGASVTLGALLSLGRSFAIFPGVRRLQTGGLYRVVRHPMYAGELLLFAAAASTLGARGLLACTLVVPALAWRITIEERLLRDEPGWQAWAARVPARLVPGVW